MIYLETKSALLFSPCKRPQTRPAVASFRPSEQKVFITKERMHVVNLS